MHLGSFYPAPFPPTGSSSSKINCLQCRRPGFNPGLGRPPGQGNGNPLQWATVHGVVKSLTRLSDKHRISPCSLALCPCLSLLPAAAVLQIPPAQGPPTALGGALWGKRLLGVERHLGASHPLGAVQSGYGEQENSGQEGPFPAPISRGRASCCQGLSRKRRTRNAKFFPLAGHLLKDFA